MAALAKMKKLRTTNIQEIEVDFRVLRFTCHDSSMLSSLGKHCKEMRWLIAVSHDPKPIDICVTVDKQVMASPEIHVTCNSEQVFPPAASGRSSKATLKQDFTWRMPFRGLIRGIQVPDYFEVRPEHMIGESWFLATVNEQRADGTFQVTVKMPNGSGGVRPIDFPVVAAANLREAQTKAPVTVPQCALVLNVPLSDPLHATLDVARDGKGELITHFFGRLTPPQPQGSEKSPRPDPKVSFDISKDHKSIKAKVGYATLHHFLLGEVRSISRDTPTRLTKVWSFEIGPYTKHTVELKKETAKSKIVTLSVDGEILCEAAAEDIESREDWWECHFRLSGQRFLEWNLYKTNADGMPLDTRGQVVQRTVFAHQCSVSFIKDIAEATLHIDNTQWQDLPDAVEPGKEECLQLSPEALMGSFGLMAPYQVDGSAPAGLSSTGLGGGAGGFFGSLFGCCTHAPDVDRRDEVIPPITTTAK